MHSDSLTPNNGLTLNRREVIKHLALASGLALSATSLNSLAASLLKPTDLSRRKLNLLTADQLLVLRELGEVIIPTTDTPGAIATGVHDFINGYAAHCLSKEEQNQLVVTLNKIADVAKNHHKKLFDQLNLSQKIELLTKMEQAKSPFTEQDRTDFKQVKALVVFAYYTSETGANKELAYLAIPGGYKGNFKFSAVGKAWALSQ
jgi:Gluconate 2-dehydrogenase subunit 3